MKNLIIGSFILTIASCSGWSIEDETLFMEQCEKTKWKIEFCECALEKSKTTFKNFDEAVKNEIIMADILLKCIDLDREENHNDSGIGQDSLAKIIN